MITHLLSEPPPNWPAQENLRRERCITVANSELEPWFFAYRKLR